MLVTRPEPDASETAARLRALEIEPVIEPLLIAQTLHTSLPPAAGFAALAVTSANALRALHDRGELPRYRHLPLYAVGDKTAATARAYGFDAVISAEGRADDLIALLARAGVAGPILYPTAKQHTADLAKALAPHGIMVVTAPVYAMVPVAALTEGTGRALETGALAAVLVYSRRTAETFVSLAGSLKNKARIGMLCLSEAVAEPLLHAHFVRVALADHPSEEAMMGLALSFARELDGARA